MTTQKDRVRALNPTNFWVKHLSVVMGIVGVYYLAGQICVALANIPMLEPVRYVTMYSLACCTIVVAYFGMHYVLSLAGRAKDVGIPIWIALLLTLISVAGLAQTLYLQHVPPLLSLAPLILLYLMASLPTDLLRTQLVGEDFENTNLSV